jgi:hypothetical protein
VALPELPKEPDRGALVAAVAWIMQSDATDEEFERVQNYLGRHLVDPASMNIIYWPDKHALAAIRGVTNPSAAEVVEIALQYRAIAL